jgi:hypothetical protein
MASGRRDYAQHRGVNLPNPAARCAGRPDRATAVIRHDGTMSSDPSATQALPSVPLDRAIVEIDQHLAASGWDQPTRLYALVATTELLRSEPALAVSLGLATDAAPDALTPVEQDELPTGVPLDEWLAGISWPPEVVGCVIAQEVLALPPSVEADVPEGQDAVGWASTHPLRREVRMVVGALRDGERQCSLRVRAINADDDVMVGPELVPLLVEALAATLAD